MYSICSTEGASLGPQPAAWHFEPPPFPWGDDVFCDTPERSARSTPAPEPEAYTELVPLDLMRVFHLVFDGAPADDLIAIGSVRPGRSKSEPYLRAEHPIPAGQLDVIAPSLFGDDPDRLRYFQFVSHRAEACSVTRNGNRITSYRGKPLWFEAKNEFVKNVYAITLDLDLGRPDTLTAAEGYREVVRLIDGEQLPSPTLVAFSGRGLYLVYIVRTAGGESIVACVDTLAYRKVLIDDLLARVRDLWPDYRASRSLARWFKASAPARYYMYDPQGSGEAVIWTLDALTDFGLDHPVNDPNATTFSATPKIVSEEDEENVRVVAARPRKRREDSNRSWKQNAAPSFRRKEELERLAAYRGMGNKSGRHLLLFFYGAAVRDIEMCRSGDIKEAQRLALEAAHRMNESFELSVSPLEVAFALRSNGRMKHKNDTVALELKVTEDEVTVLGLTSTLPPHIARLRREQTVSTQKLKKSKQDMIDSLLLKGLSVTCTARLTGFSISTVGTRKKQILSDTRIRVLQGDRIFLDQVGGGVRGYTHDE